MLQTLLPSCLNIWDFSIDSVFLSSLDGSYIFLEASLGKFGDIAQIKSRTLAPTFSRTLTFYTYMYGKSINYLKVFMTNSSGKEEIWRTHGNQGKKWIKGEITHYNFSPYQVSFLSVHHLFPGGGGRALPYKPIRDVPFFRVSFFSLESWTGYENWSDIQKRVITICSKTIDYCSPIVFVLFCNKKNSETGYRHAIFFPKRVVGDS